MAQHSSTQRQRGKVFAASLLATLTPALWASQAHAKVFELPELLIQPNQSHTSERTQNEVNDANDGARSSASTAGSTLQNLNAINSRDALRMTTPGLLNRPGNDRFGGPASIRTFGNFRAATSIDGLPGVLFQAAEGGGYSNFRIPAIAIEQINVLKGGRAVRYGNSSDGGIFQTHIKSGQDYQDHAALSVDASDAGESILQAEVADSTDRYDVYLAGSFLYGDFDGTEPPDNLDQQTVGSGTAKVGINFSEDTRLELLGIASDSETDIFRNTEAQNITSDSLFTSATLNHALDEHSAIQAGYLRSDSSSEWPARQRDRSIVIDTIFSDYFLSQSVSDSIHYDGSVGLEYKRTNSLRDNQWDNTFDDYAVKFRNTLTFNDNTAVSLGLRNTWFENDIMLDNNTQPDNLSEDSVLSFETGIAHTVYPGTRLRASVASGYSRFYSIYGNFGTDALNPAGAQDEILESITYEMGLNQKWQTVTADIAVFSITQDNVPRRNNGAIQNVEVEQSGLEAEFRADLTSSLTVAGSYAHLFDLQATRDDGVKANGNIFYGDNGVPVATDQFTLRFDYRLSPAVSLWSAGIYGLPFEQDNADGSKTEREQAYQRLDVGAGWRVTDNAAVRLRLENITDEKDFGRTLEGEPIETEGRLGRVLWAGFDYTF